MKALPIRVSESEFLSWPESMSKIELIDGDVVRSPAPTYGHQESLVRLVEALRSWGKGRRVTVAISPCDVRLAPERILQPDAFVVFQRIPRSLRGPIDVIPALCVEVLSRHLQYDRVTKRLLYAAAGVQELWTVHLGGYVERWTGPGLAHAETITDRLTTPLLPGFELSVPSLFDES
jgi:Uma2 family endonuclease